jgi:glycosyltransferase involved in cell wall biosynthesis
MSVIVPARNERVAIVATVDAILESIRASRRAPGEVEVIVVDNGSTDDTAKSVDVLGHTAVRVLRHEPPGAARARNAGADASRGRLFLFVDADTLVPASIVTRTFELVDTHGYHAGLFGIEPLTPSWRGRIWWSFWNAVRHLPLARAKALPAMMFCTRETFARLGPFDEAVAIGEEWPILAGQYRHDRRRLVYDRSTVARTSGRRMELRPFGYLRLLVKYALAILFFRFRVYYPDTIREASR